MSAEDIAGRASNKGNGCFHVSTTLDVYNLEMVVCSVHIAQLAFEETIKYANEKEQFGKPIGHLQLAMHNHDPPYFMCDYKGIRFFIIG